MMHFGKYLSGLLLISTLFVISSCKQEKKSPLTEKYGVIFDSVIRTEDGIFRGYYLGDSLQTVIKSETSKAIEEDSEYLYYEYKIDSNTTFNIRYTFNENGLNEIESDIFIENNTDLAEQTLSSFKQYFDEHYGKGLEEKGDNVWTVKSEKYGEVTIELGNEVPSFNAKTAISKISLYIFPDTTY